MSDTVVIREEKPEDFDRIYRLIEEAFKTAKVADGDEQDYAAKLREGESYIQQLALVAEVDGGIVGHIMFSRTAIEDKEGTRLPALMIAPLSVLLENRSRGIGGMLLREGLSRAKELGYGTAFLAGDPAYYGRFGFTSSAGYGIGNNLGVPDQYCLITELIPGALEGIKGTAIFL